MGTKSKQRGTKTQNEDPSQRKWRDRPSQGRQRIFTETKTYGAAKFNLTFPRRRSFTPESSSSRRGSTREDLETYKYSHVMGSARIHHQRYTTSGSESLPKWHYISEEPSVGTPPLLFPAEECRNPYQLTTYDSFNSPFVGQRVRNNHAGKRDRLRHPDTEDGASTGSKRGRHSAHRPGISGAAVLLAKILRHTFHQEGLVPHPGCYFRIEDVLGCDPVARLKLTLMDLITIVNNDGKGRFAAAYCYEDITQPATGRLFIHPDDERLAKTVGEHVPSHCSSKCLTEGHSSGTLCYRGSEDALADDVRVYHHWCRRCHPVRELTWIRANQGHSHSLFGSGLIQQYNTNEVLCNEWDCHENNLHLGRYAFHGTSWNALNAMSESLYLSPMNRFHVHFSKSIHKSITDRWTVPNVLFPEDAPRQHLERLSGLRRNANVALVIDVSGYLMKWPSQRVHRVLVDGCHARDEDGCSPPFEHEHRSDSSLINGQDWHGLFVHSLESGIIEREDYSSSSDDVMISFCLNDASSKMNPSAEGSDGLLCSHSQSLEESYSVSTNLMDDSSGHLVWETTKNGVILCSGWHVWPGGYAPPLKPIGKETIILPEEKGDDTESPVGFVDSDREDVYGSLSEGVPIELIHAVIDLDTGAMMTIEEACRRAKMDTSGLYP